MQASDDEGGAVSRMDAFYNTPELIGGMGPIRAMGGDERGMMVAAVVEMEEPETTRELHRRHRATMGQALAAYKKFQGLRRSTAWKDVEFAIPGIECKEFPVEYLDGDDDRSDPIYTIMARGVVSGHTADLIAAKHSDNNPITRLSWDKELTHIGDLEEISDDSKTGISLRVMWTEVKLPLLTTREFVNLQWAQRKASADNPRDHEWTLIASHTTHPRRPVRDDKVRALSFSAMHLEPLKPENVGSSLMEVPKTYVTIYGWLRPGGAIPSSVISLKKTVLAERIAFLRTTQFM